MKNIFSAVAPKSFQSSALFSAFLFSSLLISISFSSFLEAKTLVLTSTSAVAGTEAWYDTFEKTVTQMKQRGVYPGEGYSECRETTEFVGVYLCLYSSQLEMNLAFGRASFFVEGDDGYPVGQIVPLDNPKLVEDNQAILGHDLKGDDVLAYISAAKLACEQSKGDPNVCLSVPEADLVENFLLPKATANHDFIVIAAPTQPRKEWQATITHELSHAQFFREPKFQSVVHDFWMNVLSVADREGILAILSTMFDPTDQELIENEFQAFMLESGAETSKLHDFVANNRDQLVAALRVAGVTPIFSK